MQRALGQNTAAAGRQTHKIGGAVIDDLQKGFEHRRHEDGAARVDFGGGGIAELLHIFAEIVAQRAATLRAFAKLPGQTAQQTGGTELAACLCNLKAHQFGDGKVLEQCDDIRESLVEGGNVGVRGFLQAPVQPIKQGVRHLVRDDVAGQAREDHGAGCGCVAGPGRSLKITKEQRDLLGAVIGIVGSQRVGIDPQARNLIAFRGAGAVRFQLRAGTRCPQRLAPQRRFEMADRGHRHGIDHLLMKLRIAFGGRPAVLRQQFGFVQVDRVVKPVRCRIDVDHLDVFANRSRLQVFLPRQAQCGFIDRDGVQRFGDRRVECVDTQAALGWRQLFRFAPDRAPRRRAARRCGLGATEHGFEQRPQRP